MDETSNNCRTIVFRWIISSEKGFKVGENILRLQLYHCFMRIYKNETSIETLQKQKCYLPLF